MCEHGGNETATVSDVDFEFQQVPRGYIPVRRNGKLLFRYDPERRLIEIKHTGDEAHVIDLTTIEAG